MCTALISRLIGGLAGLLLLSAAPLARAQDAPDQQPQAPWCENAADPAASPDSLGLGLVYVPSEYAQVKARTILQFTNFTELNKDMAADLGVPETYLQANVYLVRAGGFFQPQGVPDRNVQAFYDAGQGLLQINTYGESNASTPSNWAAVVVSAGPVSSVRSVCMAHGG